MDKGSLTERFITLSRLFIQKHHQRGASHLQDPYRGQGRILALLKMEPEMSQKKLSYLLGIRPQSMGELLAKLEQNGYITRTPSAEDRRAMDIKLTSEGAKAIASIEQNRAQELAADEMFQCLNKEEQQILAGYLDRLIASAKETLGGEQNDADEHRPHPHFFGDRHMGFDGRRRDGF
ncbi:MarR family transcriptional regulator [Heliobacterium gestii]|uniref:MarR family transcriptional regulator n=1 Tax=Heliomicrobium gestii TaxID=2699 RepID=A0A845LNR7_HELGE|nr:MarR family transcriptional regulator [Heliomicrobium gestii]MBM7868319.1 DNA-binding MarR family transcriptional regulator [Heliomicrobium gestii]MZP44526.1 MarR family transcriptional regulator [Heliomicrobium gestii]